MLSDRQAYYVLLPQTAVDNTSLIYLGRRLSFGNLFERTTEKFHPREAESLPLHDEHGIRAHAQLGASEMVRYAEMVQFEQRRERAEKNKLEM